MCHRKIVENRSIFVAFIMTKTMAYFRATLFMQNNMQFSIGDAPDPEFFDYRRIRIYTLITLLT